MRNYQNIKNHYKLLLILTFTVSSCNGFEDSSNSEPLGRSIAKTMNAEVHSAYLQCYPLNSTEKDICLSRLALKYITKKQRTDAEYIQAFQYESEKMGFKRFLNEHKLPCEEVDGGPIFDDGQNSFTVTCKPVGWYQMQFNYITKEWSLYKRK